MQAARPSPFPQSRSHPYSHASTPPVPNAELKLLHPPAVKSAKGKHKEEDNWSFGWWDYVPLLEGRRPPVQWTGSSLILTAHATEPRVVCLHFPTNRQFSLPSPHAFATVPCKYERPSIITASPRDDWVFAYFPGIGIDGVGCWWRKTGFLDEWTIKEWRGFSRGDGVVSAQWLGMDREWIDNEGNAPARLPMLGPALPLTDPVLIVVTETRLCSIFYVHPPTESLKLVSASLARRCVSIEGHTLQGERVDGPQGYGLCVHATIGLGYEESSILIAIHAVYVPGFSNNSVAPRSSLLPSAQISECSGWHAWRDENSIEICEIRLSFNNYSLNFSVTPLPPIQNFLMTNQALTDLVLVPTISASPGPSTPLQAHRIVTPHSSPAAAGNAQAASSPGRSLHRIPIKGTPQKGIIEKRKGRSSVSLCLLCTVVDLGHYTASPKSKVHSYMIYRKQENQPWAFLPNPTTLTIPGVVMHLSASQLPNASHGTGALIGVLHADGHVLKRTGNKDSQRLVVGKLQMLRIQEMQIDESWDSVNLMCSIGSYGTQLPLSLTVSPNKALVCAVSAPGQLTSTSSTSIMAHPRKLSQWSHESDRAKRQFATSLDLALQNRFMPDDVIHCMVMQGVSTYSVEEILAKVLLSLESGENRMTHLRTKEIIGIAIELYRAKGIKAINGELKDDLLSRLLVGREICSLAASNLLWEDIISSKTFNPVDIWNLTSLCGFFIEFLEKLMKELVVFACVYRSGDDVYQDSKNLTSAFKVEKLENKNGDLRLADGSLSSRQFFRQNPGPSLCHIVHPYALDNVHIFLQNMLRFRALLDSRGEMKEEHELARDILRDSIEASGLSLEALNRIIADIKDDIKKSPDLTPELFRQCLAALKPPTQFTALLRRCAEKLLQGHVIEKSRLFIRPDEFVDGTLGLSDPVSEFPSVDKDTLLLDRDIITRTHLEPELRLIAVCARCGGKSGVVMNKGNWHGATNAASLNTNSRRCSSTWSAWERSWEANCLCGGIWIRGP